MMDKIKKHKPSLESLLAENKVFMGKDVIKNKQEEEKRQKEFEESVEAELRNRRAK